MQELWGCAHTSSKVPTIAWEKLCLPIEEGGLGLKQIETWNIAQTLQQVRDLESNKDTAWVRWVKAHYFKGRDWLELTP